jgi:hypothetical protein
MSFIHQQWKSFQTPLGGQGPPSWFLEPDTEILRVAEIGPNKVVVVTNHGHLVVGHFDSEGNIFYYYFAVPVEAVF